MATYTQLTQEQRCQIEALKKSGLSQESIGLLVGVSQSTISRELRRNTGLRGYRHKQAQEYRDQRRHQARPPGKLTDEVKKLIKKKLGIKWSPEQISDWFRVEMNILISHELIYQHIWLDKKHGGRLYLNLRRSGKKYQKRSNGKTRRGQIKNRTSIDERPKEVEKRKRVGDWEIDTMIGKNHVGAMVTIVERKTLFTLTAAVPNKSAEAVTAATIKLLEPYKEALHTITADNGKEFANHEEITKVLGAKVYFAHPYHSWERGLNENTNGLLRQYWPKETNFRKVSECEVDNVLEELNNRPRKKLGFRTPASLMQEYLAAQAA